MINYRFIELNSTSKSFALLEEFYVNVYKPNFVDPDPSYTLKDMKYYLDRKTKGYEGKNNSHFILALDDNNLPVAGALVDYLSKANSGFLEFIVVSEKNRKQGVGLALLENIEILLREDAKRIVRRSLDYLFLETMNPAIKPDNITVLKLFDAWGFKWLDFSYVQPVLVKGRNHVYDFIILAISYKKDVFTNITRNKLNLLLEEYFRFAFKLKNNQIDDLLIQQDQSLIDVIPIETFLNGLVI